MDNLVEVGRSKSSRLMAMAFGSDLCETANTNCECIALVDEYSLSRFCLTLALRQSSGQEKNIRPFSTIEEALSYPSADIQMVVLCTHGKTEQQVKAAIKAIHGTPARVLIVTDERASELSCFFKDALSSGICGFVSAIDTEFRTLNAAIEFALNGGIFVPPELFMHDSIDSDEPKKARRAPDQLTHREAQVLAKLREGKPNKLIAYELHMSQSTVKVHIKNIMRTIGATNRTQTVFKAQLHHPRAY